MCEKRMCENALTLFIQLEYMYNINRIDIYFRRKTDEKPNIHKIFYIEILCI